MKIALSKYQRYAALAASAAIVVVQLYQFSEEGFEGYGWILAFLVAAALAIIGIGPVTGTLTTPAKAPTAPPTPMLDKAELEAKHAQLRENADVLAIEVEERAKVIVALISTRADLKLVAAGGTASPINGALDSFIRDRALLFSLGLVGVRQAAGYHLYVTGIEFKTTEKKVFDVLAKEAISGVIAMGMPVDKDALLKSLLGELQAIRKCVVQAATAQKDGDPNVTKPLVEWLEKQGLRLSDDTLVRNAIAVS